MRLGFALSPGARRVAASSAPAVVSTDPLITVLGVPGAPVSVTIDLGGSMVTLTGTLDANGLATLLPPYAVLDGARQVTATQTLGGVVSPPSAPAVLSMPNAAKSQVLSIIGRMSMAPPAGRAEAMYALISALMAAGVWPMLDVLAVLAAHHEQASRLNWIGPTFDLQHYNLPTFNSDRGWTGGGTAYLDAAGYNPSGGGTRYGLNDASFGLWVLTPNSVSGGIDIFMAAGRMDRRPTMTGDYHVRINDGTTAYGPGGDVGGFFVADRPNSATKRQFRNGTLNGSFAIASTMNVSYLRLLSTGSGSYSNAEVAAIVAGASLTNAQHAALYAALRTYLVTVGAISS